MTELDDYYERVSPTSRAVIRQQQAQADAEGVDLADIWAQQRAAQQVADQAAQAERDAAAAEALASVTFVRPPEGSHPALAPVNAKLNRQALEAAKAPAAEQARRQAQAARERQERWRAYVEVHPRVYRDAALGAREPVKLDPESPPAWW